MFQLSLSGNEVSRLCRSVMNIIKDCDHQNHKTLGHPKGIKGPLAPANGLGLVRENCYKLILEGHCISDL